MGKNSFQLRERAGVFSLYLVALFVNATVDLGHKTVIISAIYELSGPDGLFNETEQLLLTALVSGLILLPFVMLFTVSGHLSDKFAKPNIMRWSAFAAVLITLGIAYSYHQGEYYMAFGFTLLLATQSAIYSPAKYGYIKECLGEKGLSAGNAYLMATTLTSILLGTVFFAGLFESYLGDSNPETPGELLQLVANVAWLLVGLSILEFLCTFGLKYYNTKYSTVKLAMGKWLSCGYLMDNVRAMRANEITWYAILGTVVFWSISQNLLVVFQAHAKVNLHIDSPFLVQIMLALSVIGIIVGSFISGRNAQEAIKVNNVWYGAVLIIACSIAMPVFSVPVFLTETMLGPVILGTEVSLGLVLTSASIFVFGFGAGMMIVPLNALIQASAAPDKLGSVIAGKNWVQNIAMIGLLCITSGAAYLSISSEYILYLNAIIAMVGFTIVLKKLKSIY